MTLTAPTRKDNIFNEYGVFSRRNTSCGNAIWGIWDLTECLSRLGSPGWITPSENENLSQ